MPLSEAIDFLRLQIGRIYHTSMLSRKKFSGGMPWSQLLYLTGQWKTTFTTAFSFLRDL